MSGRMYAADLGGTWAGGYRDRYALQYAREYDDRWATLSTSRRVLFAVHTMTGAMRVRQVAGLVADDPRVQIVFTTPPDEFDTGTERFVERLGVVALPWRDAVREPFDLAVAASYTELHRLRAPVVVMPHGAGHHKLVPRQPGAGQPAIRQVYGYDRERLVRNGRVIPAAIALSHAEQIAYLAAGCPEAVPAAVVVGDPCHDQIVEGLAARESHRRSLGVGDGQRLVVVSSTWGRQSLLGQQPGLVGRLLADLPATEYRIGVILHPNIEARHGRFQIRQLLNVRPGPHVELIPPDGDWQSALIAADWVIGDHGSVTLYATLTGAPILHGAFAEGDVDPRSPVADLAAVASRLRFDHNVEAQLRAAAAHRRRPRHTETSKRITSEPGGFAKNMRALLYRCLELEPWPGLHVSPVPSPARRT